jgi:tetratricopeptide (TPR) repeat protein
LGQAERYAEQALRDLPPADLIHRAGILGALADLELRQGYLRNATGYWRKALAAVQDRDNWGRLPLPLTGWVYIRLAELLYERNELAEAGEHLSQGLERVELGGDVQALIAGFLIAARLQAAIGDLAAATGYLEKARPLNVEAFAFFFGAMQAAVSDFTPQVLDGLLHQRSGGGLTVLNVQVHIGIGMK